MKKPILSIIVPCYNEEKNIPLILQKFKKAIYESEYKDKVELILVDNNSKDNSSKIIEKYLKKKEYSFALDLFQPIQGYGAAIKRGLEKANGEYICWTHADLQTPPEDTLKAFEIILKQNFPEKCYIKGNRKKRPLSDTFFTLGMSFFETILFLKPLWDINAQPNLFHRDFLKEIKKGPDDASMDLYTYYLAKRKKYKIIRFKVSFPERIHGKSSWNTDFVSRWKFIKRTIKFSFEMKRYDK